MSGKPLKTFLVKSWVKMMTLIQIKRHHLHQHRVPNHNLNLLQLNKPTKRTMRIRKKKKTRKRRKIKRRKIPMRQKKNQKLRIRKKMVNLAVIAPLHREMIILVAKPLHHQMKNLAEAAPNQQIPKIKIRAVRLMRNQKMPFLLLVVVAEDPMPKLLNQKKPKLRPKPLKKRKPHLSLNLRNARKRLIKRLLLRQPKIKRLLMLIPLKRIRNLTKMETLPPKIKREVMKTKRAKRVKINPME